MVSVVPTRLPVHQNAPNDLLPRGHLWIYAPRVIQCCDQLSRETDSDGFCVNRGTAYFFHIGDLDFTTLCGYLLRTKMDGAELEPRTPSWPIKLSVKENWNDFLYS